MTLQPNQQVKAENSNHYVTIQKKLGEGGQGEVYLVDGFSRPMALKWYKSDQATEEQKSAIRDLVQKGAPEGPAGKRFIWPFDLATIPGETQFGYLMQFIDMTCFAEMGEMQNGLKQQPRMNALCEICYQVANSYRRLHLSGYCYRDISRGNVVFNPVTGEVLICDNDNVGINRQSSSQIQGTWEYMAPEIVIGTGKPSTDTDLHSLSVLLFELWMWHHPMHGDQESQIRILDIPAKRRIYGENPIFIFDPGNTLNYPNDPDYITVRARWKFCPQSLKDAFVHAFTVGLKEPARRVTEGAWQKLFLQLQDGIISCPKCQAENIWETGMPTLPCWHCKRDVPLPPKLAISSPAGKWHVLLTSSTKVLGRQLDPTQLNDRTVLAGMAQNPANPSMWGIRNLTQTPWSATFPDGSVNEVLPQRAVPLNPGTKINIQGREAEIIA